MNDHAQTQQQINHTPEQKAFYDAFGFLVLRQLYPLEEFREIELAYEQVITHEAEAAGVGDREALRQKVVIDPDLFLDGQGNRPEEHKQREKKFVVDPEFCERHPVLRKLLEDDRILGTAEHLLGTGNLRSAGTDGSLLAGDTHWHADVGWGPMIPDGENDPYHQAGKSPMRYVPGIKIAFYLEPLDKDTGCLRVIPGSQHNPFHDQLWSLSRFNLPDSEVPRVRPQLLERWVRHGGDPQKAEQWFTDPETNLYGIASPAVPGFAIEAQPGDVIFFSHQVWHGSFGSQSGRRMFSMNFRIPSAGQ